MSDVWGCTRLLLPVYWIEDDLKDSTSIPAHERISCQGSAYLLSGFE